MQSTVRRTRNRYGSPTSVQPGASASASGEAIMLAARRRHWLRSAAPRVAVPCPRNTIATCVQSTTAAVSFSLFLCVLFVSPLWTPSPAQRQRRGQSSSPVLGRQNVRGSHGPAHHPFVKHQPSVNTPVRRNKCLFLRPLFNQASLVSMSTQTIRAWRGRSCERRGALPLHIPASPIISRARTRPL
ncbi:hypothetical protein DE146DRAFT_196134 [Phaeosphaeria sp. MPI-PUGE-AT-0046c]|nr:hypothetical protein DE146DRAFT_196134 [Phaeosphaeria sp. MPI-PUGE-AT-0046c]